MFANWATDEKVTKYLAWDIHESVEETTEILKKWVADYDNQETYHWVIAYDGTIIGTINLHNISSAHERCELGYCIGSIWWNRGIVTEAVGAVVRFAFDKLNAHKVHAQGKSTL